MNTPDYHKLQEEILKMPPEQRFYTGDGGALRGLFGENACVFGAGTYSNIEVLQSIPEDTKKLYLYYGSAGRDLLESILQLEIIKNLEWLVIGITRFYSGYHTDYTQISSLLAGARFPKLKLFEYGVDQLLANEHCLYGNLGNVTQILNNMPNLEKLYLYGNFELAEPINLPHLTDLEVLIDDWVTHINGGKITNNTLQNLLSSKFESLRLLSLYLDFDDQNYDYSIPELFLTGSNTPALKVIEINGKFKSGTKIRFNSASFFKNSDIKLQIEDIEEPDI